MFSVGTSECEGKTSPGEGPGPCFSAAMSQLGFFLFITSSGHQVTHLVDGSKWQQCHYCLPPESKSCAATDFQCSSGECVKASMHCDGHRDCSDQSDEEGCSHTVACPTKLHCERSGECLLPEWRCDGQPDCRDGSDEKVQ